MIQENKLMYMYTITHDQTTKEQKKKDIIFFFPFPNPVDLDHRSEAETLSRKNPHEKYPILNHIISISISIQLHVAKCPSSSSLSISRFLRDDLVFCCHSLQTEKQKKCPEAIHESCFPLFFSFFFSFSLDYSILNFDT